ncbi:MAG: hypothetical protein CMP44_02960 [Rickettsiales bacterium]|nr:hypothetical protein [Rickettsiales bacterium]|tara:strand:- start:4582 stop:5523 length:942 start_codon:yes stop_codon:yes gene_type:complete
MKGMKLYKKAAGGYLSALEESKPELFKTIKNYRDRLSGGEQETFDKRANIQYAATMNMPANQRDAYIKSIEKEYSKPTDAQFKQVKSSLGQRFKPTYTYYSVDKTKPPATTGYYRDLSKEIAQAEKDLSGLTLTESRQKTVPVYSYYEGRSRDQGLPGSRPGVARTTTKLPEGSKFRPATGGVIGGRGADYISPSGVRYVQQGTKKITETTTRPQRAGDADYDKKFREIKRLQTRHENRFFNQMNQASSPRVNAQNIYASMGFGNTPTTQPKPFVNPYASFGTPFGTAKKGGAVKMSKGGKAAIRGKRFTGVY